MSGTEARPSAHALSAEGIQAATAAAGRKAARARNNRVVQGAARVGFATSGLLQFVIGVLALELAVHQQRGETDQSGALKEIGRMPGGAFLLAVCVTGFLALGIWLLLSAVLPRPTAGKRLRALRVGDGGKSVVYLTLAATSITALLRGRGDSAASTADLSRALIRLPGGLVLLTLLGLAVIAVAGYLVAKGLTRRFKADLDLPRGGAATPIVALGVIGYLARGVALGVVGLLLVIAAITLDPARADGLDGALRAIAAAPAGQAALIVIGVGWLASGTYGFVRAARAVMR
jgi:hypothetical protein